MRTGLLYFIQYTIFLVGLSGCNPQVTVDKQSAPPKWERIVPAGGGATFFSIFSYSNN